MKQEKVFCLSCRHYNYQLTDYACTAPANMCRKESYASRYLAPGNTPEELNGNNLCKFYEESWYSQVENVIFNIFSKLHKTKGATNE